MGGRKKLMPKHRLALRPSVYAIIVHEGKLLLLNTRSTGTFSLPGGGVDTGEKLLDALHREVREETGIKIEPEEFAFFREEFFYYEPSEEAFHSFRFFYYCRPRTFTLLPDDQVDDEEAEKPRWIDTSDLRAGDFQSHGEAILMAIPA